MQATAIGQALLEAGFVEPVVTADNVFSDTATIFRPVQLSSLQSIDLLAEKRSATCDAQEPAWVKTIPQHDSTTGKIFIESRNRRPGERGKGVNTPTQTTTTVRS